MKQNMIYLNRVMKVINPDYFYSIGVRRFGCITLQGEYHPDAVLMLVKYNFTVTVEKTSGYIYAKRGNIEVTLTN